MQDTKEKVSSLQRLAVCLIIFSGILPNILSALLGIFAVIGAGEDREKWSGWKIGVRITYILTLIQQIIVMVLLAILITMYLIFWIWSLNSSANSIFSVLAFYIFPLINVQLCLACAVYARYIALLPDTDPPPPNPVQQPVPVPMVVYVPGIQSAGFNPAYPPGGYPIQGQPVDSKMMYPQGAVHYPQAPSGTQGQAIAPPATVVNQPQPVQNLSSQPGQSQPEKGNTKAGLIGLPPGSEPDRKGMADPNSGPAGTAPQQA